MSEPSVEYVIVYDTSSGGLEVAVNNYIRDGWRPQGGVACDRRNFDNLYLYQALIREGKQ